MHCTLLIPGLFWPRGDADAVLDGLELPALALLLARAHAQRFSSITTEGWLCQAFELERGSDWPVAPVTYELDGGEPGDAYCLRADPVHLETRREGLVLVDSRVFDVTADEAQALAATLNAHFATDAHEVHAAHPKRWYVKLAKAPLLVTCSVDDVAGKDVRAHLPTGADALAWLRVFNEAQMLLHGHAVNAAREARGEPPVNSIWLWGGGTRQAVRGRPFDVVWADDALAGALGTRAGSTSLPLPANAVDWLGDARTAPDSGAHLLVLDAAAVAHAYRDAQVWRERLREIETRFAAPLERALRERRLEALAIVVPTAQACLRFDVSRADLYKFWRTVKPLSAYS